MSGRNDKREGEEEGWESTFLKVAGAAAAAATVAGGLYALFKQPEPKAAQAFGSHQMDQRPNKEVWTKPRPGWLKLNVDGSLQSVSAGCGGVLRDSSGKWISGFAVKLAQPSGKHCPHKPEEEAIYRGLQWAWERGENRVEVESDNEGVVYSVTSGSKCRPSDDHVICEIRDLLYNRDWEATLKWIPGDANRVADKLADIARGLPSFQLREFDSPPDSCCYHLIADAQ